MIRSTRRSKLMAAFLAATTLSAVMSSCAVGPAKDAKKGGVTLRVGNLGPAELLGASDVLKSLRDYGDASGGKLTVKAYYNAALGDETQMLASVKSGALDMALITSASIASLDSAFDVTELPYFWKSKEALESVVIDRDGPIAKKLFASLETKGIKGLTFVEYGARDVISTKPLKDAADFAGVKMRVLPNKLYTEAWQKVGAVPVSVPYPEVYTALQTGTAHAADTNPMGMVTPKWYEVAHYLSMTEHIYSTAVLIVNPNKWKSIPEDLKADILKAIDSGVELNKSNATQINEKSIADMKSHGLKVVEPDRDGLAKQMEKVWPAWRDAIGAELFDAAKSVRGGE